MSKTWKKFDAQVKESKDLADRIKRLAADASGLLHQHVKMDYSDVTADPAPSYLLKSSDGNIKGQSFGPTEYLSFIVMLGELQKFLNNEAVSTGDYRASLEAVAEPIAK